MVVFPHPSAPPCVCLCLSTYLHLSSCPRRPPLPLRVCLCLFVSVWVCLRLSSCPRRPLACLSLSLCVCLCLSVSVYVSASFFVSPPPRVCLCICVCLALSASACASASVFVSAKTLPPPLRVCLRVFVSVCVCLHIACFLSSRAEILRCVGAAEPGRRPLNRLIWSIYYPKTTPDPQQTNSQMQHFGLGWFISEVSHSLKIIRPQIIFFQGIYGWDRHQPSLHGSWLRCCRQAQASTKRRLGQLVVPFLDLDLLDLLHLRWVPPRERSHGYGSKLNHQGTAGFSPSFHLPRFQFEVPIFDPQSHSSVSGCGKMNTRLEVLHRGMTKINRFTLRIFGIVGLLAPRALTCGAKVTRELTNVQTNKRESEKAGEQ